MQIQTLFVAGLTGIVGLIAGRASRPEPAAVPVAPAPGPARVAPATRSSLTFVEPAAPDPDDADEPEEPDEPDEPEEDDEGGQDIGAVLAEAGRRAAALTLRHNAILGHVDDVRGAEPLAGVTVIVTSPHLTETQTAITDAHGDYTVTDLPSGSYLLTYYYADLTVTHDNVIVTMLDPTRVAERIDPDQQAELASDEVSFTGTESLENTYVVDDIDITDE